MKCLLLGLWLLLSAINSIAQGKVCNLNRHLNDSQLKALTKATKIKRVLANSALMGRNVYEIELMLDSEDKNLLILVGEAHIKGPRSARLGKGLIKAFKTRLLEGVPKKEIDYISANIPSLSQSLGWQRSLMRLLTFNFYGSSISEAMEDGLMFMPGYNVVTYDKKTIAHEDTGSSSAILGLLQRMTDYNQNAVNLPLETGPFITPTADDSYIVTARNRRMADNILAYTSAMEVESTALVMVGSAHVEGLTELLSQKGYLSCDNF